MSWSYIKDSSNTHRPRCCVTWWGPVWAPSWTSASPCPSARPAHSPGCQCHSAASPSSPQTPSPSCKYNREGLGKCRSNNRTYGIRKKYTQNIHQEDQKTITLLKHQTLSKFGTSEKSGPPRLGSFGTLEELEYLLQSLEKSKSIGKTYIWITNSRQWKSKLPKLHTGT